MRNASHPTATLIALTAATLAAPSAAASAQSPRAETTACVAPGPALERWRPIRAAPAAADAEADALAVELVACLGSPDPELRDRIGYELLTYWLRGEKLRDDTRRRLLTNLSAGLVERGPNDALRRSFSALILAEVMRSDAVRPFMSEDDRGTLLSRATVALRDEHDYRGLEPDIGWVHPVAHLADVLWRFALHPATTTDQLALALDGVAAKVAPTEAAYTFNEGDRLARVVSTIARRGDAESALVTEWLVRFEEPTALDAWSDAFATPGGMAHLHNTKLFLRALSDQLSGTEVDPALREMLDALVTGLAAIV